MTQLLNILFVIIAAQSLFLSIHFMIKKSSNVILNKLIAIVTFSFCIMLINTYFQLNEISFGSILLQDIANNVMWFISPALYLYVIYEETLSKQVIKLHLLPYLVPFIIDVFFKWQAYDAVIIFIAFTQMTVYLLMTLWFCYKNYSHQKRFFLWVLPAIVSFFVLVLINFVLTILSIFGKQFISNTSQQSLVLLFAIPIFYIAYKEMNSKNDFGIQTKKYKTSPLSSGKTKEYLIKIIDALERNKVYRDSSLTLASFSKQLGIPSKYISQTINDSKHLSFPDFINQYRIEDVKKALVDPTNRAYTILGIAADSGFKSGSRFNTLFKKHTGLTPSTYRKKYS